MSLEFRKIKTVAEYEQFIAGYGFAYSKQALKPKHPLVVEKLSRYDRVMGVYANGEMVAGYILNFFPDRCLEDFTPEQKTATIAKLGGEDKVCELVAMWRSPKLPKPRFVSSVWPTIIMNSIGMGRKYIFGCAYRGHGMRKYYYMLSPTFVREGQSPQDLEVFHYTRFQIAGTFLVSLLDYLQKSIKTNTMKALGLTQPKHNKTAELTS